ncbi:MAG: hypothetical protein KJN72_12145 [Woeseia sp.]|nr:hypothetical protein [Woeseia sp.]
MPRTAANAQLDIELSATDQGLNALTDSGDRIKFTSGVAPWSLLSAHTPVIYPNGIETGGAVTPAASGTNDLVDVAALTCRLAGVKVSVSAAADETITRAAGGGSDFKISSITIDSGGSVAIVAGTDGTGFVETRGAAGGPPYIPTTSIEVAQVRLSSTTAAAITAAQIFSAANVHRELSGTPTWVTDFTDGEVDFDSALPAIHTGDVGKAVYAQYSSVNFVELPNVTDFVAPENAVSVTSTQIYKKTLGASSVTLNAGSFTHFYEANGIRDVIIAVLGQRVWLKFSPDPVAFGDHRLCNGFLGKTDTNSPSDNISGAFTIAATEAATHVVV